MIPDLDAIKKTRKLNLKKRSSFIQIMTRHNLKFHSENQELLLSVDMLLLVSLLGMLAAKVGERSGIIWGSWRKGGAAEIV